MTTVYKTTPTPEQHARTMQFRRVVRYFWRNKDALTEQYPDMWVAVGEEGVIDTAASSKELHEQLRAAGVPGHAAVTWFLDSEPKKLIL